MFKLILFTKRKPGMSMAEFKDHYENIHAPLAQDLYPQMRKYTRTYLSPVEHEVYATGKYPMGEPPFDCVTEVLFDNAEAFQGVLDSMITDKARFDRLSEDEANLFEVSTIWRLTAEDYD